MSSNMACSGILTGLLALGAGTLAAGLIVADQVFERAASLSTPRPPLLTVVGGGAATLLFGLIGAWAALSRPRRRALLAQILDTWLARSTDIRGA